MLTYPNNSDTAIVVFHEIYGVNQHVQNVCERLSETGYDVMCPNLLDRSVPYKYEEEGIAYNSFINMGFIQAADKAMSILRQLRSKYRTLYAIGFSVGGTIAWLCSAENGLIDAFVALYGSRIRDYLNMQPQCPSFLLFPMKETSFDVDELINKLWVKHNVDVRKYDGLHGFADPQNRNYSELASNQAFDDIISFLSNVSD